VCWVSPTDITSQDRCLFWCADFFPRIGSALIFSSLYFLVIQAISGSKVCKKLQFCNTKYKFLAFVYMYHVFTYHVNACQDEWAHFHTIFVCRKLNWPYILQERWRQESFSQLTCVLKIIQQLLLCRTLFWPVSADHSSVMNLTLPKSLVIDLLILNKSWFTIPVTWCWLLISLANMVTFFYDAFLLIHLLIVCLHVYVYSLANRFLTGFHDPTNYMVKILI
jgi:hypothetical protein